MAVTEEVIIGIEVDSGNSAQEIMTVRDELAGVEDALSDIKKEGKDETVKKQFKDLNTIVDESVLTFGQMGQTMEAYKNIAIAAGKESPIGKEAIKKAAQLQRQMDGLSTEITGLATKGKMLQASLMLAGNVVAGYTALAGVQQLVGEENEELAASLVKVQSGMAVLAGIEQIRMSLEKESILVTQGKIAIEKLSAASTTVLTAANKGLNAVLKMNPLGLIITALTVVVGAIIYFKDAIWDTIKTALKPFQFAIDMVVDALQFLNIMESDSAIATRKAEEEKARASLESAQKRVKDTENLIKAHTKLTDSMIEDMDFEIRKRKANGEETTELELEKLRVLIASAKEEQKLQKQRREDLRKEMELRLQQGKMFDEGKFAGSEYLKNLQESLKREKELQAEQLQAEQDLEIAILEIKKSKADKSKEIRDKAREDEKSAQDEADKEELERIKEAEQLKVELEEQLEDLRIQNIKDKNSRELEEMILAQQRERDALIEKYGQDTELIKELETAQKTELDQLFAEQKLADEEKRKEEAEKKKELDAEEKATEDQKLQDTLDRFAKEDAANQMQIDKYQAGVDLLSSVNDAFVDDEKKREKIKKSLAVVQLGIDTARAISSGVASASAVPFPGNIAAILTTVATVIANVGQARKLLQESGATSIPSVSSSGAAGGSGGVNPATFNNQNTTFEDEGSPQKVFVLSDDISNQQKLDNKVKLASTN